MWWKRKKQPRRNRKVVSQVTASGTIRRIAAGETTGEDVTRACVERIALREPAVQAWAYFDPERALAAARVSSRAASGPLHGLPIGIKDIFDTADMPTEYGSPLYAGHRPAADAACVALLRAAGATIIGKTVTTEFATSHPGKTRHPRSPGRTPGGSSSGSAAAVSDGMVPVALGTQTMGSVIRPAAYCGVVGFKPSFGLVNRAGVKPQAESIDTVGVLGREIDDVSSVVALLMGASVDALSETLDRAPKIVVYRGPDWSKVENYADASLDRVARLLAKSGAVVSEIGEVPLLRRALDAHLKIVVYELARALSYEWSEHRAKLSPILGGLIAAGRACTFAEYLEAQVLADKARRWIEQAFAEADTDFWLTVSAPGEAPEGLENTGDPVLNRVWSLLHLPIVTLPAGEGPNGLPLGVQLVGRCRRDPALIAAARWAADRL
jgi:Asp-tRNA(Asn)/Glu-tRNA(Gln) amidotransferase A subunit family amidase